MISSPCIACKDKKVVSDSPGLVDFAIGLVNSSESFFGNSNYGSTVINPAHQNVFQAI